MALPAAYADASDIPVEHAELYEEREGVHLLKVSPVDGFELTNPSSIKGALQNERAIRAKAEKALKPYEGLDPSEARSALEKLAEIGDGLDGDTSEKLEAMSSQLQTKYESERKRILEKFDSEKLALQSERDAARHQLSEELIRSQGAAAIAAAGGAPSLLLPVLERRARVVPQDDGQYVVEIPDKDGNARLSPNSSSLDLMTIGELVEELRESKEYSRAFDALEASGTGAKPARGGGPNSGQFVISAEDARHDHRKYRAISAAAKAAGKQVTIRE